MLLCFHMLLRFRMLLCLRMLSVRFAFTLIPSPLVMPSSWCPLQATYKREGKTPELLVKMTTEQRLELVCSPNLINHTLPTFSRYKK